LERAPEAAARDKCIHASVMGCLDPPISKMFANLFAPWGSDHHWIRRARERQLSAKPNDVPLPHLHLPTCKRVPSQNKGGSCSKLRHSLTVSRPFLRHLLVHSLLRTRSLVARHAFHFHLHLHPASVYSSQFIRPAFSLPWLERTCQPWIHVCGTHLDFSGQTRLTRASNRDGRKLTIHALVDAMQRVYNFTKPLAYLLALSGVFLCGNGRTVNLDRLAKHNVIEHDASLSRQDAQPSDDYSPIPADPNLVAHLMRVSPETFLVLKDLAVARVIRESRAVSGPLGSLHAEIARAESGLILQVFGGGALEVDKDVLYIWLVDGRLPGRWKSPIGRIGIRTTSAIGRRLSNIMDSTRDPKHTRPSPPGSYCLVPRFLGRELRLLAFGFIL